MSNVCGSLFGFMYYLANDWVGGVGEGAGIGMISIMTSSCSGMSGVKPEHVVGARVVPTKRDPPDMFPDLPLDLGLGDLLDPPDNFLFGLL